MVVTLAILCACCLDCRVGLWFGLSCGGCLLFYCGLSVCWLIVIT